MVLHTKTFATFQSLRDRTWLTFSSFECWKDEIYLARAWTMNLIYSLIAQSYPELVQQSFMACSVLSAGIEQAGSLWGLSLPHVELQLKKVLRYTPEKWLEQVWEAQCRAFKPRKRISIRHQLPPSTPLRAGNTPYSALPHLYYSPLHIWSTWHWTHQWQWLQV